jgi:hypothetical protein
MIDYATVANTSGAYPDVVSVNCTGPSTTDGTPYLKSVIDDLWGARQAIMNHAGLTPNAVSEADGASQFLTAIQNITIGPGCVIAWMGDDADPGTLGRRMIQLNGQGVLVASYPELDAVTWVGVSYNATASSFYRADDAAGTIRNTTGAYLILPDLRGYTIRGLDTAASVDPDGANRDIGMIQDWAIKMHEHYVVSHAGGEYVCDLTDIDLDLTTPDKKFLEMVVDATQSNTDVVAHDMIQAGGEWNVLSGNLSNDESRMTNVTARWVITY